MELDHTVWTRAGPRGLDPTLLGPTSRDVLNDSLGVPTEDGQRVSLVVGRASGVL